MTDVTTLLAGIRARVEAATPGPWEHDPDGYMGCGSVYATHDDIWGCNIAAPDGDLYPRSGYSPKEDMAFVAAARTDVPRLVAALEAVETVAVVYETKANSFDAKADEFIPGEVRSRYKRMAEDEREHANAIRAAVTAALGGGE